MKKRILALSIVTLVFMAALPVLLTALKSQLAFGILILWLYIGCPIFSVVLGAIAGRKVKALWYFAVAPALIALVVCLTVILIDAPTSFLLSGCYLLLGLIAMAVSFLISVYTRNQDKKIDDQIRRGTKIKK